MTAAFDCSDRRQGGDRRRGRPRRADDAATEYLRIRVTPAERTELEQVARENGVDLVTFIRDAVNTTVADYRERRIFVGRKSSPSLTL